MSVTEQLISLPMETTPNAIIHETQKPKTSPTLIGPLREHNKNFKKKESLVKDIKLVNEHKKTQKIYYL